MPLFTCLCALIWRTFLWKQIGVKQQTEKKNQLPFNRMWYGSRFYGSFPAQWNRIKSHLSKLKQIEWARWNFDITDDSNNNFTFAIISGADKCCFPYWKHCQCAWEQFQATGALWMWMCLNACIVYALLYPYMSLCVNVCEWMWESACNLIYCVCVQAKYRQRHIFFITRTHWKSLVYLSLNINKSQFSYSILMKNLFASSLR